MKERSSIAISTGWDGPSPVHGKVHEMPVISAGVATSGSGLPPVKSLHKTVTTVGVDVTDTVVVGSVHAFLGVLTGARGWNTVMPRRDADRGVVFQVPSCMISMWYSVVRVRPTKRDALVSASSATTVVELSGSSDGFGGDLRYGETDGLAGADKICTELAEMSMPGAAQKQWRAFLSVTAGPSGQPVNAIDRIGSGPWYDRLGRVVAMTVDDLRNTRPAGAEPEIVNDLPNEFGIPNHNPDGTGEVDNHHVMTGSNEQGELASNNYGDTCNDWTSAVGETGSPQSGFSWPRSMGGGGNGSHWITGFAARGCAPGVSIVQDGGGDPNVLTVGEGGDTARSTASPSAREGSDTSARYEDHSFRLPVATPLLRLRPLSTGSSLACPPCGFARV